MMLFRKSCHIFTERTESNLRVAKVKIKCQKHNNVFLFFFKSVIFSEKF